MSDTPLTHLANTSLGPQLRLIRQHLGLSQLALGERAGIPQARVSLIEHGMPASSNEIAQLARALGVLPGALMDQTLVAVAREFRERFDALITASATTPEQAEARQ